MPFGDTINTCACAFEDTSYLQSSCGASFVMFMALVDSVLRARCDVAEPCSRVGRNDLPLDNQEFDFVVVGAGAAGPVVASRLSENGRWKVLLVEAGPEEPTTSEIPAFSTAAVGTVLDWNYTTVVQENACLNKNGVCSWPRGKMVGGTNAMNGMMYTRGNPAIFDAWAAEGIEGWSFDEVLPYFLKAENNGNPDEVDAGYHGFDGPLSVQHFPFHPALADDVVAAAEELGYRKGDLNGRNQTGANVAQVMQRDGLRHSTSRAYLRPAASRHNLKVATHAQVTRVLVDKLSKTAVGVELVDNHGALRRVFARKEVILSAGTVGSAQILLLSGIGPKADLEALNIEVVKDLPVGSTVHNHVSVSVGFYIDDDSVTELTLDSLNQFLSNRTGWLSSTGLTQTTAFLVSKYATDGIPDLQVFFDGYSAGCSRTGVEGECASTGVISCGKSSCGRRYINARPTNVRPQSVGTLKLNSSNPFDHPLIDPQYLTVEQDVLVLVEGIKMLINFTKTKALSKHNFTLNTNPVSGCSDIEFATDEYWACVVRRATGAENHQVGTCRMGPASNSLAVVDPQLRVHGVKHLRVIDASIFPRSPNSNTVSNIIMAAEKGSDMIKKTWEKRY